MPSLLAVIGPAGTGKTTRLLELVGQNAAKLLTHPHQRVLAMSFMNGARARLDSSLGKAHPAIPRTVITLDKIAMIIVNRWRTAESLTLPLASSASVEGTGPVIRHYRTQLSFNEIIGRATRLLRQPGVSAWFASSFPLVVVDEFQDCLEVRLELVQTISSITHVLLGADEFQLLNSGYPETSPAVEWLAVMETSNSATVERLTKTRRTNIKGLLDAAHALRDEYPAAAATIPVVCGPAAALLASHFLYFVLQNWSH